MRARKPWRKRRWREKRGWNLRNKKKPLKVLIQIYGSFRLFNMQNLIIIKPINKNSNKLVPFYFRGYLEQIHATDVLLNCFQIIHSTLPGTHLEENCLHCYWRYSGTTWMRRGGSYKRNQLWPPPPKMFAKSYKKLVLLGIRGRGNLFGNYWKLLSSVLQSE